MKLPIIYHPQPPYREKKGIKPYCFLNTYDLREKLSNLVSLICILWKCPQDWEQSNSVDFFLKEIFLN